MRGRSGTRSTARGCAKRTVSSLVTVGGLTAQRCRPSPPPISEQAGSSCNRQSRGSDDASSHDDQQVHHRGPAPQRSPSADFNVTVETIFAVLGAPEGVPDPKPAASLQPDTGQVAAGFALYGPAAMMVITPGAGVHGFTLEREIGAYTLTHPNM